MKKILLIGAAILLLAIIALVLFVGGNLNALVAAAIEKYGSEATGTRVSVSGVDISLRQGRGAIDGLRVASPDGFDARDAFALGNITVDIDLESVREDPIVIEEIRIRAPVINAKFLKDGSSNINALRKRLQAAGEGGAKGEAAPAKNLRIKRFVFEQGKVEVDASALGIDARTLALPEIRLENLGGRDGAPPDQIARLALSAVAKQAVSEVASSEIDRLVKEKLGGSLGDKAKDLLGKLGK